MANAFLQRFPAVLWGSATPGVLYLFAKRWFDRPVALASALFFTFFFFPVYYAREAYVYAPLMLCAVVTMDYFLRLLAEGKSRRVLAWFGAGLFVVSFCHPTVLFFQLPLLGVAVLMLLANRYVFLPAAEGRKAALAVAAISVLVLLLLAPFYMQFVLNPSPHSKAGGPEYAVILNDSVGKIFMGSQPLPLLAGWLLLGIGGWAFARPGPRRDERRLMLLIVLLTAAGTAFFAHKTQYSARYFAAIIPFLYVQFTLGLFALIGPLDRALGRVLPVRRPARAWPGPLAGLAVLALILVHAVIYLPLGYRLKAKSLDYGAIARWLVEHLPPGVPYVFESGYDQRFVPGYFPTPGHLHAVPYVHGNGREEMNRLRERQQQFFMQFPEAYFVEASRHGIEPNSEHSVWDWPQHFFRNVDYIRNEPLEQMVRLGIYPGYQPDVKFDKDWLTPVRFNTRPDVENIWREAGQPALFTFDQWRCEQVNQFTYARVARGAAGAVQVRNLRGRPVSGRFVLVGALVAPDQAYPLEVRLNNEPIHASQKFPGQLWQVETDPAVLPAGDHVLRVSVAGGAAPEAQALILLQVHLAEGTPAPAPAPASEP
jgi:hypothetical protein